MRERRREKEFNRARKFVVSRKLRKLEWANSELVFGDVISKIRKIRKIRKLKKRDGPEPQVHGSGNLIQALLKHDLIDEFRLKIFPVTFGKGKQLFAEGTIPSGFELIECRASPKGVVAATYHRAGRPAGCEEPGHEGSSWHSRDPRQK